MKKPTISIIVPVYNVEKYLDRCIESIIGQTFKDIEIILVDDGSTDSSGIICDNYSFLDSRIKVIHKVNGGLSDARNTGIEIANGEWIGFVDGDDYIDLQMYEKLYSLIITYNADISICGIRDCYDNAKYEQTEYQDEFTCSGKEALELTLLGKKIAVSICNKLIKRELLRELRFLVGRTYEDAFIVPDLLLNSNVVACTTLSMYNYWHREGSITTEKFSIRRLDVIEAYIRTKGIIIKECPELLAVAMFRVYWAYFVVLDSILADKNYKNIPYYKEIVEYLKTNWKEIVCNSNFSKGRRVSSILLKINVKLYNLLIKIRNYKKGTIK